jgi:hypothetical protein
VRSLWKNEFTLSKAANRYAQDPRMLMVMDEEEEVMTIVEQIMNIKRAGAKEEA